MGSYRFGPLGRLIVVQIPDDGFDMPVDEFGGLHESLNGTRTKDVLGRKTTYKINLEGLDTRALSWFEMAYHGALGSALWFVDEQRTNRLSREVSSALSVWSDIDPFSNLNGTRTTVPNTVSLLPDVQGGAPGLTPAPDSAQQWVSTAGGIVRCGPMLPVQPGEHMVFSLYALSGTPTLEFTPYDAAGVALAQSGPLTDVIASVPPRRYETYVVPASGVAAIQPCIRHAGAQTSVWTALQLEQGDIPTPWVLGGGASRVLVNDFPLSRRRVGNYVSGNLVLLEV